MANVENVISWFKAREGKVSYSQTYRYGPNSYDCSSAVYSALIEAGFLPKGTALGNTETLYALEGQLLQPIGRGEARRGDIFVSGIKGQSLGNGGHTGVFLDNQTIIHCTLGGGKNGIVTTPATNWMGDYNGWPVYCYRLKGNDSGNEETNKNKNGGISMFKCIIDGAHWGVWGNKRFYIPTPVQSEFFSKLVKANNGDIAVNNWEKNSMQWKTIEAMTDLSSMAM